MGLRFWVLNGFGGINPTYNITIFQRIYIFFDLLSLYIQKLFYPLPLNLYYHFQPSYQLLSLHLLNTILITLGYTALTFMAWKKRLFAIFFGLIWFLVFLLPSLIFINPENLFAERYVFTSTIGFSILVAVLLSRLLQYSKNGKIAVIGLMGIFALISFFSIYGRNQLWKNDISIFTDTLKKSPDADLIRYDLALEYLNQGNDQLFQEQLMQIIKRGTWINLDRVYGNMGELYLKQGNILGSLPYFCKSKTNFDILAGQIQGLDNKSFMLLYDRILNSSIFHPAPAENTITLKSKDCSYPEGCLLIFSSKLPKNETILPFLIVGKTASNDVVRSRYFEFNPQTLEIALGIDRKFEESKIHFWLPGCNNVYYETETTIK